MGGKSGGASGPSDKVPADFAADHPGATNADFYGAVQANEARQQQQNMFEQMFGGFGGAGHAPKGFEGPEGPSQEELDRTAGLNNRDTLYSEYLDAADQAADIVNDQISEERSNAMLLGIDFEITDEQKSGRISDSFSELFGNSKFGELEGLFDKWGNPEGFTEFTVTPGADKSKNTTSTKPSNEYKDPSQGKSPHNKSKLLDEDKLGDNSLLGN